MKKKIEWLCVSLILILGFVLRFWHISTVPPGLSNDEISIASEAYSIINTGRDTYGTLLPISFRSYNDYKAPLYIYLAAPFINFIGNNELAVRIPSVLFGTLTLFGFYLLLKEFKFGSKNSLVGMLLLAITPWHVYTSRIASESNLAVCLLTFGVYFFLIAVNNKKAIIPTFTLLSLSLYSYHSERVLTPLILLLLTAIYFKEFKNKRNIILIWAGFIFLLLPLVADMLFLKGATRANNEFLMNDILLGSQLANVQNAITKASIFLIFWINRYLQYIGLSYLFGQGLQINAGYGAPYFGLINIVEVPLFLLGLVSLLQFKNIKKDILVISWLLAAPLVPSLTLGDLNLMRNLPMVVPITFTVIEGLVFLNKRNSNMLILVIILLISANFALFYRYYTKYFPIYFSEKWSYGFKDLALYTNKNIDKYNKIVFDYHYGTESNLYGAPSLFVFYFNKMDPRDFQKSSNGDGVLKFKKYEFRQVDWTKEEINPGTLYIVGVRTTPVLNQKVKEVYSVKLLDGKKAFVAYESF